MTAVLSAPQPATVLVTVPPPPCPDCEVLTGYRVEVSSGSYPSSWAFDERELDDAVVRWADEGLDRCSLIAEAYRPHDDKYDPPTLYSTFTRARGWSAWGYA